MGTGDSLALAPRCVPRMALLGATRPSDTITRASVGAASFVGADPVPTTSDSSSSRDVGSVAGPRRAPWPRKATTQKVKVGPKSSVTTGEIRGQR